MKLKLFTIFIFINLYAYSNNVDSLKAELLSVSDINKKNSILNLLAYKYLNSNLDSAESYLKKALDLSVQNSNYYELTSSLLIKGMIYEASAKFDLSYKYYKIAEAISKKFSYWDLLSDCYNNLGTLYSWKKDQTKFSLKYLKKCLSIDSLLKKNQETAITHCNIGYIYLSLDSIDLASYHFDKTIEISVQSNFKKGEVIGLSGKIKIFLKNKDYNNVFLFSIRAIKEAESYTAISSIYFSMGIAYKEIFDYSNAIMAFDSCIAYAKIIDKKILIEPAYDELSNTYFLKKDYKNAYKYARLFENIKSEINREKMSSTIKEIESRSLIEQKEKEIGYLNITKNLYKKISESEKRNKYFLLLVFVFSITIAISNLHRILPDTKSIVISVFIAIAVMFIITTGIILLGFNSKEYTQTSFFSVFVDVLTVATFPIFFIVLILERLMLNKNIKTAKSLTHQIKEYKIQPDNSMVNFKFENDSNSLSIAIKDLICIEANDNYAAFYYYHNNSVYNNLFRATLKNIESQLKEQNEIIRCHKSYLVNITYIKHITGNAKGYKLHIEEIDFEIPVSRNFPREILMKVSKDVI